MLKNKSLLDQNMMKWTLPSTILLKIVEVDIFIHLNIDVCMQLNV